jgi:rubrerythrin
VFFHVGNCELFGTELDEPYVNNVTCNFFTTDPDPATVAKARIKKFKLSGRYDKVAEEYEKIGDAEKAAEARSMGKVACVQPTDLDSLVQQLVERGQTLTYFCVHCGVSLKVGAKNEPQKSCPNCKYDLSAIDIAKLISQHL